MLWQELSKLYPSRTFVNNPDQDGMGIGLIEYSSKVAVPNT
jgi:hypothetical protein